MDKKWFMWIHYKWLVEPYLSPTMTLSIDNFSCLFAFYELADRKIDGVFFENYPLKHGNYKNLI